MQYTPSWCWVCWVFFVYVGAEVTIVSNLSELLKQPDFGGYQSSQVAPLSLCIGEAS
jgi:fucose permease